MLKLPLLRLGLALSVLGAPAYAESIELPANTILSLPKGGSIQIPQVEVDLTIDKTTIRLGESATLGWIATNAKDCQASLGWSGQRDVSGNFGVSPTETTDYGLSCSDIFGRLTEDRLTLTVLAPQPATLSFNVDKPSIQVGQSAMLAWSATAESCGASGDWSGAKPLVGSQGVSPTAAASYTMTCPGINGGPSATQTVALDVTTPQPPTAWMTFNLTCVDGKTLTLTQDAAVDIGDYVGQFVKQKSFRARASGNGDYRDNYTVFFRPDADGKRQEVVVEYGTEVDFSGAVPKPARGAPLIGAPACTATLSGGGLSAPLASAVPPQVFGTRYRLQSAPRPIVRTYADLVAMKAILPLDKTLSYGAIAPFAVTWKGPLDSGGFALGMGAPGERNDLGPITEWQAYYLVTGDKTAETSMRAGAEATGTMPFWVRDAATGNFVDPAAHPTISFNGTNKPQWAIPRAAAPAGAKNVFALELSHMPAAAFVPYLLTDDPYYLEGDQATALYAVLESYLYRDYWKIPRLVDLGEPRAVGWGMRHLFLESELAPDSAPSWLQPKAFWKPFVDDNKVFMQKYLDNKNTPMTTVFGLIYPMRLAPFMNDYNNIVFSRAVWSGKHDDWRPILEYVSRSRMTMSDPTDKLGWDHRWQTPYTLFVLDARLGKSATGQPDYGPGITTAPNAPTSWAEFWSIYQKVAPTGYGTSGAYKQDNWTDPATWVADKLVRLQSGYIPEARGALSALNLAGISGADVAEKWLREHTASDLANAPDGGRSTGKWD